MRALALTLFAVLLTGCGTTASTRLDVTPIASVSFDVRDERPMDQRATRKSRISYGTMTELGDDGISPSPIELVKTWLQNGFSKPLSGKVVVLRVFSVQIVDPDAIVDEQRFSSAAYSTPGANPLSILLARVMVGGIESVRSEKTVGVKIEGRIGEREFAARGGGSFRGRVTESDVNSVIVQALDALLKEVNEIVLPEKDAL